MPKRTWAATTRSCSQKKRIFKQKKFDLRRIDCRQIHSSHTMRLIRAGDLVSFRGHHDVEATLFLVDHESCQGEHKRALDTYGNGNLILFGKKLNADVGGGPEFARILFADTFYTYGIVRKAVASRFVKHLRQRLKAVRTIQKRWRTCVSDPSFAVCRRRLSREFVELEDVCLALYAHSMKL